MREGYSLGRRVEEWGEDTYEGRSREDGRRVAIRVLNYVGMSTKEKHQVVNEVNILKELQHANIVRCRGHYIDKQKGHLYIVTDPCNHGSLAHLITQSPLSQSRVWDLFTDLVLAVHHIHNEQKQPILHRNIKPSSVFLYEEGCAKLGNFAFVRKLEDGEQFSQTQLPSSPYVSPEQIEGKIYTKKTDIWALGCLLYEMCTQQPPFRGKNQFETAKLIRDQQPKKTQFSNEMNRVISWSLDKNAENRPNISELQGVPEVNLRIRQRRYAKQSELIKKREATLVAKEEELLQLEKQLEEQRLLSTNKIEEFDLKSVFNSCTYDNSQSSGCIKPNLKKQYTIQSEINKKNSKNYQPQKKKIKTHTFRSHLMK